MYIESKITDYLIFILSLHIIVYILRLRRYHYVYIELISLIVGGCVLVVKMIKIKFTMKLSLGNLLLGNCY